jgi:hypothetical protein
MIMRGCERSAAVIRLLVDERFRSAKNSAVAYAIRVPGGRTPPPGAPALAARVIAELKGAAV